MSVVYLTFVEDGGMIGVEWASINAGEEAHLLHKWNIIPPSKQHLSPLALTKRSLDSSTNANRRFFSLN